MFLRAWSSGRSPNRTGLCLFRRPPVVVLVLALLLVSACSAGTAPSSPTQTPYPTYTPQPTYTPYPAPAVTLTLVDDFFQESHIVVVRGTRVVWVNEGDNPHTSTSASGSADQWDTGMLQNGERGDHVFLTSGLFLYFCRVHEHMTASIRVLA